MTLAATMAAKACGRSHCPRLIYFSVINYVQVNLYWLCQLVGVFFKCQLESGDINIKGRESFLLTLGVFSLSALSRAGKSPVAN